MAKSEKIQTPITDFINRTVASTGIPVESIANYQSSKSLVALFKVAQCYEDETGKAITPSNVTSNSKGVTATFGRKGVNIRKIEKCVGCSAVKASFKTDDKKNVLVIKT